jgi:predicted dehydrogenase
MTPLRCAVVGTGHLGSIHARLLNSIEHVELVGVVDPNPESRKRVAEQCQTQAFEHHRQLQGRLDAAVVATPTQYHYGVAADLLQDNVHLLIEKPVTSTVAEANGLIAMAEQRQRILQVGHVERFNPAWKAAAPQLEQPKYIEALRAGPYTFRSTDVSVVLDLMIHDLDLILSLVDSEVQQVDALGLTVFGPHEDMAHAQLKFANGCIANVNASRVNDEPRRAMKVFSATGFAEVDFGQCQTRIVRPGPQLLAGELDMSTVPADQRPQLQATMFESILPCEQATLERGNAILEEQQEFVAAIRDGSRVRVTGPDGRDALSVAQQILNSIQSHRWNGTATGPIGSHLLPAPTKSHQERAA